VTIGDSLLPSAPEDGSADGSPHMTGNSAPPNRLDSRQCRGTPTLLSGTVVGGEGWTLPPPPEGARGTVGAPGSDGHALEKAGAQVRRGYLQSPFWHGTVYCYGH
jgi:hypothetical protein